MLWIRALLMAVDLRGDLTTVLLISAASVGGAASRMPRRWVAGFTLVELIIFIVVLGVATTGVFAALNRGNIASVEPIYQVRALELAQTQLDEIFGKRYDEASPNGGFPPCDSGETGASPCTGALGPEEGSATDYDDVDDYDGYSPALAAPYSGFSLDVSVQYAGADIGLTNTQAKYISVIVTPTPGEPVEVGAYRGNF